MAGFSFIGGAEEAWITDELGDERAGKVFLRATQWGQLGLLLAAPLSLTLVNLFQLNIAMITGAGILLSLGVFLFCLMPENNFRRVQQVEHKTFRRLGQQMIDGASAVRTNATPWCIMVQSTLVCGSGQRGL